MYINLSQSKYLKNNDDDAVLIHEVTKILIINLKNNSRLKKNNTYLSSHGN